MGMAASQARFLGLTARKTNVEYKGQQINQARTALANETANLYNEMLSLQVPTPPVVSDYYNTSYTFTDGDSNCEVISGLGQNTCQVQIETKEVQNRSQAANSGNPCTIGYEDGIPYINGNRLTKLSGDTAGSSVATAKLEEILEDGVELVDGGGFVVTNGTDTKNVANWNEYQAAVAAGYSFAEDNDNNILYSYTKNSKAYYIQSSYIPENDDCVHSVVIPQEFYENEYSLYTTETMTDCIWNKDTSGRYNVLTGNLNGETATYSLNYTQTEDEAAYEQAMLDYEYQYNQYQKEVEDINSKTAQIQEQDRGLELQLRQCDTEQESLAKELESIKKVLTDNIDRVFKTFDA